MRRPSCTLEKARKMSRFCGAADRRVPKNRAPGPRSIALLLCRRNPFFPLHPQICWWHFFLFTKKKFRFFKMNTAKLSWSSESEKKCNLWQPQHCLLQKLKSTFFKIFLEVRGIMQPLIHNLFHYFSGFVPLCESRHPPPHVKPPLAIRRSWSFALYITIE